MSRTRHSPSRGELSAVWLVAMLGLIPGAAGARTADLPQPPAAPQTAGSIRGIVMDTTNGVGVGRVSVRLQSTGEMAVTTDDGRFELPAVAPGDQELYVSAVDFILVKRAVSVAAGSASEVTIVLSEGTGTLTETVDVRGVMVTTRREPAVAAEQTLAGRELQQLRGVLTNDPLRAVQVMPAVAAGDDFRSEFAIRGLGVQYMTFTFEGVSTPFLLHTVQQVHDSGSVAMVNGDVLEEVSLLSGAYPQRQGNRLGSEIDFRMREGSRARAQSHLSVSAIDASGVVEGPLGGSKRGSWLFSARKSYLDLFVERLYPVQNISFGFADTQAKASFDVTPRQQVQVAFTGGRSRLNRLPDTLGAGNLRTADNQSTMGVMTWRYLPSARFSLVQRVAIAANTFRNLSRDGAELDGGDAQDVVYRADVLVAPSARFLFEGGGEARRSAGSGREQRLVNGRFQSREDYDSSAMAGALYAQARIQGAGAGGTERPRASGLAAASLTTGARIDRWSLVGRTTASPWIQALWPVSPALTVRAGAGVHRQEPDFAEVLGSRGTPDLRAERAYTADLGIEGRLGGTARWQMTVYNREDRDLLRLPDVEQRVVNGALVNASVTSKYRNALDGHARGVEWLLQRQSPNGFSGWASYALGYARYHDVTTGETYWGDLDQRHTLNLYGTYRATDRLSFSARFRYGSNFPTAGYWDAHDGAFFVGTERNAIRVPAYSRLDVRANRTFTWSQKRLTLFVEAINAANHTNARFALPSIDRRTFVATNLYEAMIPVLPTLGILLEF